MSRDARAVTLGLAISALVAGLCVGAPWAARRAAHPPPPETQPLRYTGDAPA
jgi:hypothetical protein